MPARVCVRVCVWKCLSTGGIQHPFSPPSLSLTAFLSNSSAQKLQGEDGHQDIGSPGMGVPRKLQLSDSIQGMDLLEL